MPLALTTVLGNSQRLDGGAMFGNAPKALWSRWVEVDAQNRIPLACRALLVEDGARRVLLEAGIGAFFEPALRDRYGVVEPDHVLLRELAALGLSDADIDLVVLSHLHFDHAGGLLAPWRAEAAPTLLFPNARFVVGRTAWERALHPHPRDRASFVPELNALLEGSGRLVIVDGDRCDALGDGWRFHTSDGHTPGLLLADIELPGGPVVFGGDLVPGVPWVHAPITMGYDRWPERLIDEKLALLESLVARSGRLVYTHDPHIAMSRIGWDGKRFHAVDPVPSLSRWTG